ncbi:hypothetical protein MMC22_006791 [Lobaria immixta]|nr:hypothetical protein [Lobaria immixta]
MIALKSVKKLGMKSSNSEISAHHSARTSSDEGDESDRHALLTVWEKAENETNHPYETESKGRRWRRGPEIWSSQVKRIGIIVTVFLLLAFCALILWWKTSAAHIENSTIYRPNLHDDYILDPNWSFGSKPARREYRWTIQDQEHNPDGVYRPMMLINSQFPGPMIECNEGDTIVVHVDNQAANATSFHWHGIYQNGSNWMDGTVGITQCPIAPGQKFTYEFRIIGQSGTYWYHSHQGTQASDGLLGPLIVHSKEERSLQRINYASDRIIMIQDHYHDLTGALLMKYLEPDRENAEPVPDGALINGMNIRDCDALSHRICNNSTSSIPRFDLAKNQNHRLRFINVGAFAEFQIQIDEHEFAVTEADGTDVEPVYFHRLNISPGQRYSIVITASVDPAASFWLRARMVTACFAEENPSLVPEIRGIVQYSQSSQLPVATSSALAGKPNSKDWDEIDELICKDMNTTQLVPAEPISVVGRPDAFFYLRSNFEIGAWKLSRGFFNTSSWRSDVNSPSLERFIEGYTSGNKDFVLSAPGINHRAFSLDREMVIQVNEIQTIDVLIDNFDDGNHPLHLHGYKYFVLAQGHGYFDPHLYDTMNLSNPLRRDTASAEAFGWILIRLVTDNPGIWAFHCHISWHTEAGLLMQFLIRPEMVGGWVLPKANKALCEAEGLRKGAGPRDEIWFGNRG